MQDSVEKIITSYFSAVSKTSFKWNGKIFYPKPLTISPKLLREAICPPYCGACCKSHTLDYLPNEEHPYELQKRLLLFNNKEVSIYSDLQKGEKYYCKHVNKENGRCNIHKTNPFSCDFELTRFIHRKNNSNLLITSLFGRAWNMTRIVDNKKGALCYITDPNKSTIKDIKRKISRLKNWCDHFEIISWCDEIINWINWGGKEQVTFDPHTQNYKKRGFIK